VVEIKTAAEIQAMRAAGRVVAQILATVRGQAEAGTRLTELDEAARAVLAAAGATSPFLGYRAAFAPVPYPAAICTSVNDAALHGIPDGYRLADGDLLSVDCGAVLDGWVSDAARTYVERYTTFFGAGALENVGAAVDHRIEQLHQHLLAGDARRTVARQLVFHHRKRPRRLIAHRYQAMISQDEGDCRGAGHVGVGLAHQRRRHEARVLFDIETA